MKRIMAIFSPRTVLLATLCLLAGSAFSQSDSTNTHKMHEAWLQHREDRQAEGGRQWRHQGRSRQHNRIKYTQEQRQQAMAINKNYQQQSADLFKQDKITLKEYKSRLLILQKDRKQKLADLLTPQQKDQMAAAKKRRMENNQVHQVARMERLRLHLGLTDDQVAKLKSGQEDLRNQFQSVRMDDNLLPQQKMEQLKTLMAKRNDNFKAVLTPDQYAKFEQMHNQRHGYHGRS